jgi:DHA2 family multidrug resistance protein
LLALLRNEGGSVGTSAAQTIHERRDQFHSLRLGENLDQLNPALNSYLDQVQPGLLQQNGDPAATKQQALQLLDNLRAEQSSALAYFDTFFVFAVVAVFLIGLVFFMRRSVAAKAAHLAAE